MTGKIVTITGAERENILYLEIVPALRGADTDSTSSKISFISGFPGTFALQIQLILLTCFLNKIVNALQD